MSAETWQGFTAGDRVELAHTDDAWTSLRPGSRGTFRSATRVSGLGFTQLHVDWDDGSTLMLVPEDGDAIRHAPVEVAAPEAVADLHRITEKE